MAAWMMSPYCVTGPAGGIKGVYAPKGLVRQRAGTVSGPLKRQERRTRLSIPFI